MHDSVGQVMEFGLQQAVRWGQGQVDKPSPSSSVRLVLGKEHFVELDRVQVHRD